MSLKEKISHSFNKVSQSIWRFPLSYLFLLFATISNAIYLENSETISERWLICFMAGTLLATVGQMLFERFFAAQKNRRYLLMGLALIATAVFAFLFAPIPIESLRFSVKTAVIVFALILAFIWIPTIQNAQFSFHQSLLAFIKNFFTALLFGVILSLGLLLIHIAISTLLFELDYQLVTHTLNIIWCFVVPLYCIALTPSPDGQQAITVPRFLEVLLKYIIIPITLIYTSILIVYLLINISGSFWTNNLLEPLLVSYAIISFIIYLLSFNLQPNKYISLYQQWFPKVMVPIVLFQTLASILRIETNGLTIGRYFVILFGVFATVAAVIFSLNKEKMHWWSIALLLVMAVISITPPLDAFTMSLNNHEKQLVRLLEKNQMWDGNQITPHAQLDEADAIAITKLALHLDENDYQTDLLGDNFNFYADFEETFGFEPTYFNSNRRTNVVKSVNWNWDQYPTIDIEGFDHFMVLNWYDYIDPIEIEDEKGAFTLESYVNEDKYIVINLTNEAGEEILQFDSQELFEQALEGAEEGLTPEQGIMTVANEALEMKIVAVYLRSTSSAYSGNVYILLNFK
ncbi:DUF4153 domain-containing protein [Ruoffia tabacinasalis]|uniref:DUF4153 domain-containing protein n=1 Tax=Ruoffia tabacinasalis TaxID=87458 RepID=UPI003F9A7FA2